MRVGEEEMSIILGPLVASKPGRSGREKAKEGPRSAGGGRMRRWPRDGELLEVAAGGCGRKAKREGGEEGGEMETRFPQLTVPRILGSFWEERTGCSIAESCTLTWPMPFEA